MVLWVILIVLLVLAGLYLLAIKPRSEAKTTLEPLKTDYAHRGLWS